MRLAGRVNPATITIAVALFVVAIPFVAARFVAPGSLNPRVHFVPDEPTDPLPQATSVTLVVAPVEGEVVRTAARLREVTALCFAAILYAAQQEMREQHSPRSVEELTAGMERSGLLPPGLSRGRVPGSFFHPNRGQADSSVYLRYQPEPVVVEVVSLGLERLDGPALIMRWPGEPPLTHTAHSSAINRVQIPPQGFIYYAANRLDSVQVPPPFCSPAEIIKLGWSKQYLRPAAPQPEARP